jgi:hypothetical protein
MSTRSTARDTDFYAWALEQAALLRAGQIADADLALIADEIESMGKTEKRELVSRLTVLLLHLLKWTHQPGLRGNSLRLSIANARDEIADLIADNPSLKAQLDALVASDYRYARRAAAAAETNMAEEIFSSPVSVELLDHIRRSVLAGLS